MIDEIAFFFFLDVKIFYFIMFAYTRVEQKPFGLWEAELTRNLNIIIQSWFFFH